MTTFTAILAQRWPSLTEKERLPLIEHLVRTGEILGRWNSRGELIAYDEAGLHAYISAAARESAHIRPPAIPA